MRSLLLLFLILAPALALAAPTRDEQLQLDERLDHMAGLLTSPWTINKIAINSRSRLPVQLQPGLPPFYQQPERAQVLPGTAPTVIIKP